MPARLFVVSGKSRFPGYVVIRLTDNAANQGVSLLRLLLPILLGIVFLGFSSPALAAGLAKQQILDLVRDEAVLRLQVPRQDVVVEWKGASLESLVPALPPGTVTLEIAKTARLGGVGNVPVQILIDGKKFRTIFPRLDVQIFQQVFVAKSRIPRGSLVGGREVETVRQAVSSTSGQPLVSLEAVVGAEAVRDIPEGTVLTAQMFKLPTMVKLGAVVAVVLTVGELTIITSGEARQNGTKGQLIKVINLDSKREFTARVIGPDRVEIKLED